MKPLAPSEYAESLSKLGLNPSSLPRMNQLTPEQLRGVMGLFSRSLGVPCKHCHEANFRATTKNKQLATRMWDEWVHALRLTNEQGERSVLFCDSCHRGSAKMLTRDDRRALSGWMEREFVGRLASADASKPALTCASCHGEPFAGRFLSH